MSALISATRIPALLLCGLIASLTAFAQTESAPAPAPATTPAPAPPPAPRAVVPTEISTSTAFLVAPKLLVTVNHGLINRERVFVGTGRGSKFIRARVLASDERLDLALLEADVAGEPLAIAQWESVPIGIEVAALGFPRSAGSPGDQRITFGIVNGEHFLKGRSDWFQLSAEIHRGNSGGPVIASDGSVVGVITHKLDAAKAIEKGNDLPQNVNFALKSRHLVEFLRAQSLAVTPQPLNLSRQLRPFEIFKRSSGSVFMVVSTRPKDKVDPGIVLP